MVSMKKGHKMQWCHFRSHMRALVALHGVGKRKQGKLLVSDCQVISRLGVDGHGENLITMTPPHSLYRFTFTSKPLLNSDSPISL
jgi:hypothetical protein